jgi:hypothetical protein
MQENAVLSGTYIDATRKLLELAAYDEAKEWTLLQMKLALYWEQMVPLFVYTKEIEIWPMSCL